MQQNILDSSKNKAVMETHLSNQQRAFLKVLHWCGIAEPPLIVIP